MKLAHLFEGNNDDHFDALERTGFFGAAGAGCIFLAKDTGRFLIAHRSPMVEQPGTWGGWGGAINRGEDPETAVRREVAEEAGYHGHYDLIPLYVFAKGTFRYYNFLVEVDSEFDPQLDWETQGYEWCEWGQWPKPLHFGLVALFSDAQSVHKIEKAMSMLKENPVTEDDDYDWDERPRIDPNAIVQGNWIDTPYRRGFEGKSGIYLVRAGSNTAYGNYNGGFQSTDAAEQYNQDNLGGEFKVAVRR